MTKNDMQAHATTADIQAIIAAHKAAVTAQSVPALPMSQPKIHAMSLDEPAQPVADPSPTPAPKPAPEPVSDAALGDFLSGHLPELIQTAQAIVTPPFAFSEVLQLSQAVSQAVHDGLPLAKGAQAAQVVNLVAGYVWDKYATPLLPPMVRPFGGILRGLMLAGIEAAYRFGVKKVGK